ncbi:MAG TPA: hypothetical protein VD995_18075 [Azospirillum sp.]|nr:hypothetical protein [Azospirillum sp.]
MTTLPNTEALRLQQPRTDDVRGGGANRPHDSVAQSLHFAAMLEALNDTGAAQEGEGLAAAPAAGPSLTRPAPDAQRVGAPMASLIAQGGFDALGGAEPEAPLAPAGIATATQEAGQFAVANDVRWMAHLMAAES